MRISWISGRLYWYTLQHALQCTATHCDILQHTATRATHRDALRPTATHCNTLHYIALHCNTLHHTATHCSTLHCSTLQHTATHCNTLQHTVNHDKSLQIIAHHCKSLPNTLIALIMQVMMTTCMFTRSHTHAFVEIALPNTLMAGHDKGHQSVWQCNCHNRAQ